MRRFLISVASVAALLCNLAVPLQVRAAGGQTATPITHLVIIFDENNSFDHYFGTYPVALNRPGETPFHAAADTPAINGLTPTLLNNNPNLANAGNPMRLSPSEGSTCDNINKYTPEQEAFDNGLLDKFNITSVAAECGSGFFFAPNLAMYYYDGNTVTALWNYAQHFAMSDNFFDSEFGGTVEGHLNLLSGQTNGLVVMSGETVASTVVSNGTVINNINPISDDCALPTSPTGSSPNISMTGNNIGNLLNAAKVTWGWFYDGFARTGFSGGVATCSSLYNPHYAPFNYYPSTSNPHHTPPSSPAAIGTGADAANHNYDLSNLWEAIDAGNMPAVTFIKASSPNTGHPMDGTPLQEQTFLVNTINRLMQSRYWKLGEVCSSIHNNFNQLSTTSQIFLQQMDGRLSGLLNGYARLLLAAAQQQQYLRSTDQNEIKREVATLQKSLSSDPPRVQEINKKRIEILSKRLEKYDKLCENRKVVDAQCSAVEDVLHLIRDQSVTMRDPQQISDQLDNLVKDVEETEQTVQQVEAIFSDLTPDMEGIMSMDDTSTSTSSAPNRTRIPS